jgi:hypothetical protein
VIPPPRERLPALLATTVALTLSFLVLAAYLVKAGALIAYPWDWSPDEGLQLDYASRLATGTAPLYSGSFVPFPSVYGPLLPVLLAPMLRTADEALVAGRLLALGWTLAGVAATYALVRRRGPAVLALAAAALSLAPFDYSFWHMLIRPDGLMLALWLLAAVVLLPARLSRGAGVLGWRRVAIGTALLLAAAFTKPTAVIHAAPLVVGWFAVDRRSALRLASTVAALGAGLVLLLEWATAGAFLWVTRAWTLHEIQPGLAQVILRHSAASLWPLVAVAAAALVAARGRRGELLRDSSLLVLAGAVLIVPLLGKYGASWNYMLPFLPALSVLGVSWWGLVLPEGDHPRARPLALAAVAALALALSMTREFPLPSALDERTARAFYAFVVEHTRRTGGPILATRPELAYFLVGQTVEMEGSSFGQLARHKTPGTERVLQRLLDRHYTLLVELHGLPAGGWAEAAGRGYVHAGGCNLSFYFGTTPVHLFTRRDLALFLAPPAGTRCGGPVAAAAPAGS